MPTRTAAGSGDWARGLRLVAAGYALWESIGAIVVGTFWNELLDRYAAVAREGLGSEGDAVWAEGHSLTFEDAVALALG